MDSEQKYPDEILLGNEARMESNLQRLSIEHRKPADLELYKAEVSAQLKLLRETKKKMDNGRSFYGKVIGDTFDMLIQLLEDEDAYLKNPKKGLEPVLNLEAQNDLATFLSNLNQKHYNK